MKTESQALELIRQKAQYERMAAECEKRLRELAGIDSRPKRAERRSDPARFIERCNLGREVA